MEEIKKNENKVNNTEMVYFINSTWQIGRSLIHIAVELDDFRLVKQCIQLNADVNKTGNNGRTALFSCKNLEIAKFLVDNGIDINILNHGGQTAVVDLYNRGNIDRIKYLAGITNLDLENSKNNSSTLLQRMISNQEVDLSLFKIVIPRTNNINRIDRNSASVQWQNIDLGMKESNRQRISTWGKDFYTTTNYIYETDVVMLNLSFNLNKTNTKAKLLQSEFGEKEF